VAIDVRLLIAVQVQTEDAPPAGHGQGAVWQHLPAYTITIPPLRTRREDILFLAERFRHEANVALGKTVRGFSTAAAEYLVTYAWPGNVRELRDTVRCAVGGSTERIERHHLHPHL
jgi:DNA-binding NtrC family response regulator